MPMRRAIAMISCLSSPASGRKTGMEDAAPTATMFCSVCEATWPRLSPAMMARARSRARDALGDSQHHAAIEQQAVAFRRGARNLPLNRFERNQVELRRELIRHQPLDQRARHVHRGFSRTRAAAPEVHETHVRAAPHHFVSGDRRIESAGEQAEHAARGVGRQAAGTGDFSRIDQHRAGRDFDAAGQLGFVEFHADFAAGGTQVFEQIAADVGLDLRGACRKRFVAALGADGEGCERQRLDLRPGRLAQRIEIVARAAPDDPGHGEVGDAHDAPERGDDRLGRRIFGEMDDHAVAGLPDFLDRELRQSCGAAPAETFRGRNCGCSP